MYEIEELLRWPLLLYLGESLTDVEDVDALARAGEALKVFGQDVPLDCGRDALRNRGAAMRNVAMLRGAKVPR